MELPEGKKRELKRDNSILREFHASDSPDVLVLYHHLRDRAFDAYNAIEYHNQMLRYYQGGITVTMVAPRTIQGENYFMVCLQHSQSQRNIICELAFLCMRQFCGISMLVKKKCFVCNKVTSKRCKACHCACFCSRECQVAGWSQHKRLCKLVSKSNVVVDTETVALDVDT